MSKGTVILDYGHGGVDSGAVAGKHIEKVYNLDTGKACKEELEKYGVTVYETRKADEYLSISQRCAIAKKYKNVDYMVSIHHNSGGGDRGECIHSIFGTKGKELAEVISKELEVIGQTTVKVYDREYKGNDYYGIIRGTTIPTVITEVAFLDNVKDVTICDTLEERQRNGRAIAHAILKKLNIQVKTDTDKDGWVKFEKGWSYKKSGEWLYGWQEINGKWYRFNEHGYALVGWQEVNNKWYYFNEDCSMKTGWLKDNDKWYYLKEDGSMAIGWINVNGKDYYLHKNGVMENDHIDLDGKCYHFADSGELIKTMGI